MGPKSPDRTKVSFAAVDEPKLELRAQPGNRFYDQRVGMPQESWSKDPK